LALSRLDGRAWLLAAFALAGCHPLAQPFDHQAYVWQREWSEAHIEALADSRDLLSGLRVLAAQIHPVEGPVQVRVDAALLAADGRPVVAVMRLDGGLASLDRRLIIADLNEVVSRWRAARVNLVGIELDYDCATSKLDAYAEFITDLRKGLARDLSVSITVLPTWIGSKDLPRLLGKVDQAVLQVHSVLSPEQGLFDAQQARSWIDAFAQLSPCPFRIALPAYGAGLLHADDGSLRVESETSLPITGERIELRVDPAVVSTFLRTLERDRPQGVLGVVWFRLPLRDDRRAWALPTLRAVIRDAPLVEDVALQLRESGPARDLVVRNIGTLDVAMPESISLSPGNCSAADALAGYTYQRTSIGLEFRRYEAARLAPDGERVIGWLRCRNPESEVIHATR
jgi:hypothetical protein